MNTVPYSTVIIVTLWYVRLYSNVYSRPTLSSVHYKSARRSVLSRVWQPYRTRYSYSNVVLVVRPSVCASVCHALALYWLNRSSTDHQAMIALRQPTGLTSKILVIFLRSHPTGARYRCGSLIRQVAQLSQRDLRRDAVSQLNSCQLLHNCMKNYIWLEGLPFHVV